MAIQVGKWHLAENGTLSAWIPHTQHVSQIYLPLKACYTGQTQSSHLYEYDVNNGISVVDGITIEYAYTIPLTQLKQRKVKWQWQGLYVADVVIEFNIEQHIQEDSNSKPEQRQTLKEINELIAKLNAEKYVPHNFRISEGIVLCQHCGELLSELKKTTGGKGCYNL
jgi:hypothetical protein